MRNPQASFNVKPSNPSRGKSPRSHTDIIAFPTWLLGTAKHTCLSAEQKGHLQSHRSSPSSPPTGSENETATQLSLEMQEMDAMRNLSTCEGSALLRAPRRHPTYYNHMAQHSPEVLDIHTTASPQSCGHANKCGLKHETAMLPSVHELEHAAVSSRASKSHAICYSHRVMP